MSKVSVFDHAWIDLVFEGRNQSYGAYQLRRQDPKTTMLALFTGIGLMVSMVGIPTVINYFAPKEVAAIDTPVPTIIEVDKLDKIFTQTEKPKPEPVTEQPAVAATAAAPTTRFTNELVATNEPVEAPPVIDEVLNTTPGQTTTAGTPGGIATTPATTGTSGGTGTTVTEETGSGLETTASVDVMPSFPGGMPEFYSQVGKKFRVPSLEDGSTLKVYVSFIVEKDGTMSNVKVLRDPGYDLGKEAIRVLQSIKTKWEPGKKKGHPVRTAYNLPIIVNVK